MTHYVAFIEDAGPDFAVGVWFPDLPGCFSAGDTLDEAMSNASEAVALWFEDIESDGRAVPRARTPSELKTDPEVAAEMAKYAIALIPAPDVAFQPAAE
ncbi:type II toxin-antitoxin system HicB family antitoxin [Bosea sp. (in: a-proteobacteria)]|uniref:type II toxin-antitoxin system HicB family antitoxin n=1 Tax=Bosea sp. (in: a-proteobacteria) TaxID=1871050 RepID=UPI0027366A44|nr:type II toxin-antitoxin system HicB family antitoxin [Bosea sp. (in: a-proteobacteria)]MDP3256550.1 type II toxin-antitoxin system HicB family antitoxin [Bosea sp. (in: a-proteobacteria)]